MRGLWQDFRYGLRGLANQPGFTALAVIALALGSGAATTIFSVIQNVLLDPFPYTNAERVVTFYIHDVNNKNPYGRSAFKVPEFLEYQEQNHVFEELIGGGTEDVLYSTPEGTEQFDGAYLTPNTFSFLGVPALLGRTMTPDDAKPGAPPVFVMAYKAWVKSFNSDRSILGRTFVLNGVPTTLIGVMPKRFTKRGADMWRLQALDRGDQQSDRRYFLLQARMKPGISLPQVEADINVIAHRLAQTYPKDYPKNFTVHAESWVDSLVGPFRKTLYTLAAAVGLLVLIACGNVANMLLARATAREKEMAVRASMGASRWRIVRQLLVESFLLACGGAAFGCVLAYGGIQALVTVIPDGVIPREADIRLNVPALLFSLGAAAFTALLFGLAPALQAAKKDIVEPLKDSGKGVSGGFRKGRLRNTLVIIEVALSLVLLTGAGLLIRTFVALQQVDLGINPNNILVARLPLPKGQYTTAAAKQHFFSELLARVRAIPGVIVSTETTDVPPYGGIGSDIEIPGKTHAERWDAIFQLCSEEYARTLGIRLLQGRFLSEADVNGARKVALVNQTLVKKYLGDENPIGHQIKINMLETFQESPVANPVFEVIGVIADAKNQGVRDPPMPEILIPYTITGGFERGVLIKTAGNPLLLQNALRHEIWALDRNVAVTTARTLDDYLAMYSYAQPRFMLILLGVFAGVGLVLVATGVYSVIAYTVSRQTHEIGIRMALGAGRSDVLRMILALGLRLIAIGAVAGLAVSLAVTRFLATELWGVSPNDPMTLAAVVAVIVIAGLGACYVPARRAMRLDPMVALRYE